jgi:hypothetical protein
VGVWEGTFIRVDAGGEVTDRHRLRVVAALANGNEWRQRNTYSWDDGRTQTLAVSGTFAPDGRLVLDDGRIRGFGWETESDNIIVAWEYVAEPGTRMWELVSLPDADHRLRTWQHIRHGTFEGVTIIDERRVGHRE